jgi:CRP-like cAMP-binding protein
MARGIPREVIRHFENVPLFASVSKRRLRAIVIAADEVDVPAGKAVVRQGEHDRYLYVITQGTAVVTVGGRKRNELFPGDFFGELAFLSGAPRSATVTAYTDMTVMALEPRHLDVIVAKEPAIARELLSAMAKRVKQNDRSPTS